MGACVSQPGGTSEEEKAKHREAERQLRETKVKLDSQVKVWLFLEITYPSSASASKQLKLIKDITIYFFFLLDDDRP